MRKRKDDDAARLLNWLNAMPQDIDTNVKHSAQLTITLSVSNWLVLREAAFWKDSTMGAVASKAIEESDEVMTWSEGGEPDSPAEA